MLLSQRKVQTTVVIILPTANREISLTLKNKGRKIARCWLILKLYEFFLSVSKNKKNEAFLFQQLLLNDPQKVHALKLHFEVSMSNRRLQLRKFGSLTNQSNKQTAGEPIKIRQYMSVTEGAGKFGRVASNDLHLIGLKKIVIWKPRYSKDIKDSLSTRMQRARLCYCLGRCQSFQSWRLKWGAKR